MRSRSGTISGLAAGLGLAILAKLVLGLSLGQCIVVLAVVATATVCAQIKSIPKPTPWPQAKPKWRQGMSLDFTDPSWGMMHQDGTVGALGLRRMRQIAAARLAPFDVAWEDVAAHQPRALARAEVILGRDMVWGLTGRRPVDGDRLIGWLNQLERGK
ncbi:MAG: hypothetical protein LBR19_08915 [Bifidobacteriaceae bacterium]|jgi:hypothetical protein|nr:hypothetical protein [Bifidobacteriaceae bacterium]